MAQLTGRAVPPAWAMATVAIGGAVGTSARYGLGQRFPVEPGEFPVTTLVENVVGAAMLGLVAAVLVTGRGSPTWVRLLVGTGMLGSFTTFSTAASEVILLVDDGRSWLAVAYVAATLLVGLIAAALGVDLGRRLSRARPGTIDPGPIDPGPIDPGPIDTEEP